MATTLPKYVIIQSNSNNKYLHLYAENSLRYDGDYSFGPETRFEIVPATTGTGLVHIRCLQNNRYWSTTWVNIAGGINYVTAGAVEPEENRSNDHCTLFQPIFMDPNNNRVGKLRDVRTQLYVCSLGVYSGGGLHLESSCDSDECTFIDWESVVMLPDIIRIKGDGGHHLMASGGEGYMDYLNQADNTSRFDYEVSPSRDGGIRLKSRYFGTYWTKSDSISNWVLLKPASPTVHDTNTVFLPTILRRNRIIMQCLMNNRYCKLYTDDVMISCLATHRTYPDEYSNMDIEEPVTEREIDNVRYHLNHARIYDERSLALITRDSTNITQDPLISQLDLSAIVSDTTTWSTSITLQVGVMMTGTLGVPLMAMDGTIGISAEVRQPMNWGETNTEAHEVHGAVETITVAPMTRVRTSLMETRVSYDIPFSYIQRDFLENGSIKAYEKDDGIFTGCSSYGYTYEHVHLPLE